MQQRKDHETCARKRHYYSETDALIHAAFQTEQHGVKLRVYRCPTCRGYHLARRKEHPLEP